MANVYAVVFVGINFVALTNDETVQRPVIITNLKFATARIFQLIELADGNFFAAHESVALFSFQGATFKSNNMPGIASAAQKTKKDV